MRLYQDLAEYYHAIESNHRDLDNDVAFIRSLLHGRKDPSLLDLGCGSGEHIEKLTRFGIRCTGMDSSSEMLTVARNRYNGRARFLHGDMRSFDCYEEFDLVTCLFGSFDYMIQDDDVEKVLWNTWRALKPGGSALFEVWNSAPVARIGEKRMSHVSTTRYGETRIDRERGFHQIGEQGKTVVQVDYRYTIHETGGSRMITDTHFMRAFSPREMNGFLKTNGFIVEKIYSSTLKEPFQERSSRMLILFRKIV